MPTLPSNDLRSEAKDYQRDRNHNAKWARGSAPAHGRRCPHIDNAFEDDACAACAKRPQHRDYTRRCGRHFAELKHNMNQKNISQRATMARKVFRNEVVEATDGPGTRVSDSSGEEDVKDASAAPLPDAEVMYSYDATHGPGRGSGILSQALNQAVLRYENKETEKLVKEYDIVDDGKDTAEGYTADEDNDFELIEYAHLK